MRLRLPVRGLTRSRWAAIGAAVAVCLGAGGLQLAGASNPDPSPVLTTITPCRLLDTRPGNIGIGPRRTPLNAGETFTTPVRGAVGNCTIPATALGVVANITITDPTATSHLTVWPTGRPQPNSSNLNWSANQAATPNQVTAALGDGGAINLTSPSGTVNVIVDITGYLTDHDHDDRYYTEAEVDALFAAVTVPLHDHDGRYYTEAEVDALIAGVATAQDEHGQTHVIVPADGTPTENGAALRAALTAITDASETRPYLLDLEPGTFDVGGPLTTKPYVTLAGAGAEATRIEATASSDDLDFGAEGAGIELVGGSGLVDLTIETTPADTDQLSIAVLVTGPLPTRIEGVHAVTAAGPTTQSSWAVVAQGFAALTIRDSTLQTLGNATASRALAVITADVDVHDSDLLAEGPATLRYAAYIVPLGADLQIDGSRLRGIAYGAAGSEPRIATSMLDGTASNVICVGTYDAAFAPLGPDCLPVP